MGHLDVSACSLTLPDGRVLLDDVSFRVAEGSKVALIGANGAGKTSLLRIIGGTLSASSGAVQVAGGLGIMWQFIDESAETIADALLSVAPRPVREAAERLAAAERRMTEVATESAQLSYASALAAWGDAGGYEAEVLWDTCTVAALGEPFEACRERDVRTLSGGEQKRLVLEALLRGSHEVLLLDEPDNYLDVAGKRWLEEQLRATAKSVLFVSHDRELLARTADSIVTLELGAAGNTTWTHPGGFATYHEARERRFERLDELRRRWDDEHAKLKALVQMYKQKAAYNSDMTSRYRAAQTRLARFEQAGPPQERPREQRIDMRLRGGRTGKRAIICDHLELVGLTDPFDLEVWYGDRLAVLGPNGTGKSHLLRLLAAGGSQPDVQHRPVGDLPIEPVEHTGTARLGARVRPGWFAQTQGRPDLHGRTLVEILHRGDEHRDGMDRETASRALDRYELATSAEQDFGSLSGGQKARFQILLLELGGATLLLLDEPTDNLDLLSAEALQQALRAFDGTVLAVTHDRWFAREFDRYLVIDDAGAVRETAEPVWAA
ncbi:ABC-F family ATP-binding cassette domain-containing protein [Aeromicrobium sp. YIM 150415]|uniref:ABC-F family ATP-binding cassette domain-containing protein n=1 Tax=Aeromicrobium sp. YIM 150415 TaxID=2803912 RepID=UPI001965AA84|nr:ATP-binding cassette domain-containing protein [Aeromicrobium sp. YIM 150415]MBM9463922.1 ABC-F family ATP-binding cassette domain-containing protein [Aeromicrobium sp. YIM 150415]